MQRKWLTLSVILIFGLAFLCRVVWLNIIPNGFNWDETAYSYNAYSLLQTGKDEFGETWPLFLQSFGDYKPALLSYILARSFAIFPATNLTARMVMVVISLFGLVGWWYFLHKKLGAKEAVLGLLLMSLMPMHLHYSRAVMDPMLGFSLMMMGFGLVAAGNKHLRIFGGVFLGLSMYAYNSQRLVVPMLVFGWWYLNVRILPFFNWGWLKQPNKFWKQIPAWIWPVLLTTFLLGINSVFGQAAARAKAVLVFNSPEVRSYRPHVLAQEYSLNKPWLRFVTLPIEQPIYKFSENYLSHFSPSFLFFGQVLSPRHGFSRYGNLLLWTLPFMVIYLINRPKKDKLTDFFTWWLLVGAIPAGLSDDVPHSGRALIMLPAFIYFAVMGFNQCKEHCGKFVDIFYVGAFLALTVNVFLYGRDMYLFFPEESAKYWQGQTKDLSLRVRELSQTQPVLVDSAEIDPVIFYAWYNLISPREFQEMHEADRNTGRRVLGNVEFLAGIKDNQTLLSQSKVTIVSPSEIKDLGESTEIIYGFARAGNALPAYYVYKK